MEQVLLLLWPKYRGQVPTAFPVPLALPTWKYISKATRRVLLVFFHIIVTYIPTCIFDEHEKISKLGQEITRYVLQIST